MALEPPKYLPEDVLRVILSKVPVKYAIRCRCVCKTWYHIIGTSSFAKTHLTYQNSASNPNKYMLYHVDYMCTLLAHSHSIYDGSLNYSKLYNLSDILRRYTGTSYYFGREIYGICNGLLCLSDYRYDIGHDIYLWNPTCRKIKKLPHPDYSVFKDADRHYHKTSLSFGYYGDDFKVIVIAPLGKSYIVAYIVLVYSLNSNSWNMTQIESHDDAYVKDVFYRYCVKETKFVDGTVYIIESDLVRCFNLSNETIRVIPFPKEFGRRYDFTTEVYGDSIAIFKFKFKYESRSLSMWILKDKSSFVLAWEKKMDNIKNSCYYQVGLLNNGKYLVSWMKEGSKKFYLCDVDSPGLREVTCMRGSPYIYNSHIHPNYVESLFLLDEDHLDPIIFYGINRKKLPESAV